MALPFEPVGEGPDQHNWDLLERQFPVGPQHIQNNAVTTVKIANNAVTDAKLATKIIRGRISSAGGVTRGTGFTASKTGTGAYTVTFDVAFAAAPVVVATAVDNNDFAVRHSTVTPASTTNVGFVAFDTSAGTAADSAFDFIAISV